MPHLDTRVVLRIGPPSRARHMALGVASTSQAQPEKGGSGAG